MLNMYFVFVPESCLNCGNTFRLFEWSVLLYISWVTVSLHDKRMFHLFRLNLISNAYACVCISKSFSLPALRTVLADGNAAL